MVGGGEECRCCRCMSKDGTSAAGGGGTSAAGGGGTEVGMKHFLGWPHQFCISE